MSIILCLEERDGGRGHRRIHLEGALRGEGEALLGGIVLEAAGQPAQVWAKEPNAQVHPKAGAQNQAVPVQDDGFIISEEGGGASGNSVRENPPVPA